MNKAIQIEADLKYCRKCDKIAWNVQNNPWVQLLCNGVNNELQARWQKKRDDAIAAGLKPSAYEIQHGPQKIAYIEIDAQGNPTVSKLRFRLPEECPYFLEYTLDNDKAN